MSDSDSYMILRRATSPEDERVWREVAEIEAPYISSALDRYVRAENEAGRHAAGQYLVVRTGGFSAERFEVSARTEYDIDKLDQAVPDEVAA